MMCQGLLVLLVFLCSYQNVHGDCYLHIPRGSNNRLDGMRGNVKDASRLFDSQNNGKGGYNVPEKSRFKGDWFENKYIMSKSNDVGNNAVGKSILRVEWTNQHGCNDKDLSCNIVLQYMCQEEDYDGENKMRNGQEIETKKEKKGRKEKVKIETYEEYKDKRFNNTKEDVKFGLHESWDWYRKCIGRERNKGLYIADQQLVGSFSEYTRQNPGGGKSGYECPEERDYYPYWHPTDWKDIAVLTDPGGDFDCSYFEKNSFNRAEKGECLELWNPKLKWDKRNNPWKYSECNNKDCCQTNENESRKWVMFQSYLEYNDKSKEDCNKDENGDESWGIPYLSEDVEKLQGNDPEDWKKCLVRPSPVICRKSNYSRANHLGNGLDGKALTYDWLIPHFSKPQRCVLRIRYNMTTKDYNAATTDSLNYVNNIKGDYVIKNNPSIKVKVGTSGREIPLQLALNTAQTGRTFQDRSHLFQLIPRKDNICKDSTIYNINVRGKRGNIVETFPAVEYDFAPKRLTISEKDCVHFQWAGSNRNPRRNAGNGRKGTDRSNFVAMAEPGLSYPLEYTTGTMFEKATLVQAVDQNEENPVTKTSEDVVVYMGTSCLCKSVAELARFFQKKWHSVTSFANLDYSPASCSGVLLQFPPGNYDYMSTRNNQFSNRNQKGRLIVV